MGSLGSILNSTLVFLQHGFEQVNAVQGLLIALFATALMREWRQLFAVALGACVVDIVFDALLPIVTKGVNVSEIHLPHLLQTAFWDYAVSLYVGFVMIIAMFFAVKSVASLGRARRGRFRSKAHG